MKHPYRWTWHSRISVRFIRDNQEANFFKRRKISKLVLILEKGVWIYVNILHTYTYTVKLSNIFKEVKKEWIISEISQTTNFTFVHHFYHPTQKSGTDVIERKKREKRTKCESVNGLSDYLILTDLYVKGYLLKSPIMQWESSVRDKR